VPVREGRRKLEVWWKKKGESKKKERRTLRNIWRERKKMEEKGCIPKDNGER
jgi:hypothetical protein